MVSNMDRKLKHGSHPVLTWNCWNSVVEIDPTGARKIDKAKSTERVDGMVTLAMAVGLASRSPKRESIRAPANGPYGPRS